MKAAGSRDRFPEMSLAFRIAAASALFGLMAVAMAGALGYWALSRQLEERVSVELHGKRGLLQHLLSEIARVEAIPADAHRFADLLIGHDDLHLVVLDTRDARVLASSSPTALESAGRAVSAGDSPTRWQSATKKHYASLAGTLTVRDGQPVRYVLSLDLQADRNLLAGVARATVIGLPLMLVLVALGAWTVARTGLFPLRRFTRLASSITSSSLGQRMSADGLPPELKDLAHDFNAMLERIDEGMTRLSEFSGDLAHEMRTPVATLLGQSQVALLKSRSAEELRDVLADNIDELDRLKRLIADMLFLARAGEGAAALDRTPVSLGDEARRVADFLSIAAEDRGVSVDVTGDASVQADRLLVQRAITNLLTNAIRHADASSTVSVAVQTDDGTATVAVANKGRPIPAGQLGRIFERFVRLDAARARTDGGSGLGLAIVKSIMQAHGGRVHASSDDTGATVFMLVFPGA